MSIPIQASSFLSGTYLEPVEIEIEAAHVFKNRGSNRNGCGFVMPDGKECMKAQIHPDHLGIPLSLNRIKSGGGYRTFDSFKHAWQAILVKKLRESDLPAGWTTETWTPEPGTPRLMLVTAESVVTFPKNQKQRDQGNFRWFLEKALGDALEEGGWIEDDSYFPVKHFEHGGMQFEVIPGRARTRILLFPSL